MGARDRLKSANMQAMNAVDQTLESLNRNIVEDKIKQPEVIPEVKIEAANNEISNTIESDKNEIYKKPGRPAKWKEEHTRISMMMSQELKNKIDTASIFFNNSITEYITTLIEKDLEKNFDIYKKQEELLKSFNRI